MDRQYFTIIPNMIDDEDLSPLAFRLYFHIKRVAGEDGTCYQTTETLAESCKMSTGSISKAKQELLDKRLIKKTTINTGRGKPLHTIRVVDVWNKNMKKYYSADPINSPDEFITSPNEFISSPDEIKKNPINNNPIKEEINCADAQEPTRVPCDDDGLEIPEKKTRKKKPESKSLYPLAQAIEQVTGVSGEANKSQIYSEAKLMARDPRITPEEIIKQFAPGGDWYRCDWRGQKGQRPTLTQIRPTIFTFVEAKKQNQPKGWGPVERMMQRAEQEEKNG